MLNELCNLNGISGREHAVRDYIISHLPSDAEYRIDPLDIGVQQLSLLQNLKQLFFVQQCLLFLKNLCFNLFLSFQVLH